MNTYTYEGQAIDSIELKCLLVSRGLKLAERGILPSASTWMPMGRPVQGTMRPPELDYYRRVKELFAELYTTYNLEPPDTRGSNVCIEREIWNWAQGQTKLAADELL